MQRRVTVKSGRSLSESLTPTAVRFLIQQLSTALRNTILYKIHISPILPSALLSLKYLSLLLFSPDISYFRKIANKTGYIE